MPSFNEVLRRVFGVGRKDASAESRKRSYPEDPSLWLLARLAQQQQTVLDPLANPTYATGVRVISSTLGSMPLRIFRGKDDDKEEITERIDPWYRLLRKPNPWMTGTGLIDATSRHILFSETSESFWISLNAQGEPVGEGEIPTMIVPVWGNDVTEEAPNGVLTGWRVRSILGRTNVLFPLHSVTQIADALDPAKSYRGYGRLRACRLALQNEDKSQRWNSAFFDRDASPGGTITSGKDGRDLTPAEAREVQKLWQDAHQGIGKSQGIAVLPSGLQFNAQAVKHTDMAFIEGLKWYRETIASNLGVPLFYFSSDSNGFNTTRHQRLTLYSQGVKPIADRIVEAINEFLIEPRSTPKEIASGTGVWVEFDASQVLAEDEETRLANWQKAQDGGVPYNEATKVYGLPFEAQDWGDESTFSTQRVTAEEVFAPPEPTPPALAPFAGGDAPPPPPSGAPAKDPKGEPTDNPDQGKEGKPGRAYSEEVRVEVDARARRDRLWAEFERAIRPHEASFRKVFSNHVHMVRTEILEFIRQTGGRSVRTSKDDIDRYLDEARHRWDAALQEAAKPEYAKTAVSALNQLAKELPTGKLQYVNAADPRVAEFIAEKVLNVTTINETMVESLRATLTEAVSKNADVKEMQEAVRDTFGVSKSSALRIARTEAASATNGVRQVGMAAEGIEKSEWLSSRDAFVRETHDIDGEVQPLGSPFSNGCTYPGDVAAPASEVVNCRCTSAPVLD